MTREDIKTINDIVHKTIYGFFDICGDEETPMTDKDKLLLEVNKAVCNNIKDLEQEPCEDAISRQAALDAFGLSEKTRKYGGDHSGYDTMMLYEIQQTLEDLPPVTPKQRTGHWIESRCDMYVCSECGNTYTDLSGERYGMNCCPNCGAKMVEPQESEG